MIFFILKFSPHNNPVVEIQLLSPTFQMWKLGLWQLSNFLSASKWQIEDSYLDLILSENKLWKTLCSSIRCHYNKTYIGQEGIQNQNESHLCTRNTLQKPLFVIKSYILRFFSLFLKLPLFSNVYIGKPTIYTIFKINCHQ